MAHESGATGVMDGAAGGWVAAVPEVLVVPVLVPCPERAVGGAGDWAMSAAASSDRAGSRGMVGGKA